MPCYHPIPAWQGEILPSGKRGMVFKVGSSEPALSILEHKLPCGQCIGCRLDYALDWAVRCVHEMQMHESNCFVTCTYDKMPPDESLQLEHWQLFMKLIRNEFGPTRHFHAGEYGSENGRPHDHALLFGIDFADKKTFTKTQAGSWIYVSDKLSGLWKKASSTGGYCSLGEVTFESAGYLARYLIGRPTLRRKVKDSYGNYVVGSDGLFVREWTDEAIARYGERIDRKTGEIVLAKRPEYLTMSRNPGIGATWFEKYWSDVYPHDYVRIRGDVKMPPPRTYDVWYEKKNPVDMRRIKMERLSRNQKLEEVWSDELQKIQLLDSHSPWRLKVMEEVKAAQVAFLKKSKELHSDLQSLSSL